MAVMVGFDPDHDESNLPDLSDRNDVIWFLERNDIPLPDGLTIEKIKSRGGWWAIDKESFSFWVERYSSGPFPATSPGEGGIPTPARWHVRKRYSLDLPIGEWSVTEQMREFRFNGTYLSEEIRAVTILEQDNIPAVESHMTMWVHR